MDRELAERLVKAAVDLDGALGALDDVVTSITDEALKARLVDQLGAIFEVLDAGFIRRACAVDPDLDPDIC